MTKQDIPQIKDAEKVEMPSGLDLLRAPFPPNLISKLPKPTKFQTDEVKKDFSKGVRCNVCGGWHHPKVVHIDYVGHAALTDRLLDADPNWNWEPVAIKPNGTPETDENGGMWIKLTVCGVTRLGYGHSDGKRGGDAIKELIGDALRNAAMRFGAALDLWHKGDLHLDSDKDSEYNGDAPVSKNVSVEQKPDPSVISENMVKAVSGAANLDRLKGIWGYPDFKRDLAWLKAEHPEQAAHVEAAKNTRKEELEQPADDLGGDSIPF